MRSFTRLLPFLVALPVAVSLSGCGKEGPPPYSIDLEIWGIFDDSEAYRKAFGGYRSVNDAHIGQIEYRKKTEESYRDDLVSSFAEGNGPDVFLIRNAWLPDFKNLIEPAPESIVSEKEFRDAFADVAISDLVIDGKVYGVPLTIDSLALYYNKDIFNAAGITAPPATWEAFLDDVRILNEIDFYGNINQSAVAMGTMKNINRSTDILLTLALQKGLPVKPDYRDAFSDAVPFGDGAMREAAEFYTQFSRVGSPYYSWNVNQHYSLDTFYEGKLAMMINYSWHMDTIRRKNAKLNFGVAPLPQFEGKAPSNMSNYWVFVVAKNKDPNVPTGQAPKFPVDRYRELRIAESWQMLDYLALPHPGGTLTLRNFLNPEFSVDIPLAHDPTREYLKQSGQPAARRDILEEQRGDPWLSPFAYGNLIARSWRTADVDSSEGSLAKEMETVVYGDQTIERALSLVASQIQALKK